MANYLHLAAKSFVSEIGVCVRSCIYIVVTIIRCKDLAHPGYPAPTQS
jgi:hypothetical protein